MSGTAGVQILTNREFIARFGKAANRARQVSCACLCHDTGGGVQDLHGDLPGCPCKAVPVDTATAVDTVTAIEETPVEDVPVGGKPFHGWSCDCYECQWYLDRGLPRPGEGW